MDELKRLDEVTYLGSHEGKDFEQENVMEVQDKPKIKLELDQKKVIISLKNGTKTSDNYAENQLRKIKPNIEPTEPNKAKIEPKNQPEKEEVIGKPKATDFQSSKADLDEPRIALKIDTKPSQDESKNIQNKPINMENKLQYLQKNQHVEKIHRGQKRKSFLRNLLKSG